MQNQKITVPIIKNRKKENKKITMLTAYDYPLAKLIDEVGVDIILVGDSLGMVSLGYESTIPVTMSEMLHHIKAVRRATRFSLLVGDMPFGSYNTFPQAIKNATKFMKAGCEAVKMEGGREIRDIIEGLTKRGIPVIGHLGLTPQRISEFGGFKIQGRDKESAEKISEDAFLLQQAGAFSIVLECIPRELAKSITEKLKIPTIGIGAGKYCDGQVLVTQDLLGFNEWTPKFVKKYTNLSEVILKALRDYKEEVMANKFPAEEHSYDSPSQNSFRTVDYTD
ncbi:MAG: 3-methyl-2-oxobutanoate hydroxymethyltransferase [Candidatus Omnitrophica bacterium]|nr:3-methyl-2-oxobutanoate hydroxymethyltransferase [Candidatus Omnitrophota bacterium]